MFFGVSIGAIAFYYFIFRAMDAWDEVSAEYKNKNRTIKMPEAAPKPTAEQIEFHNYLMSFQKKQIEVVLPPLKNRR